MLKTDKQWASRLSIGMDSKMYLRILSRARRSFNKVSGYTLRHIRSPYWRLISISSMLPSPQTSFGGQS